MALDKEPGELSDEELASMLDALQAESDSRFEVRRRLSGLGAKARLCLEDAGLGDSTLSDEKFGQQLLIMATYTPSVEPASGGEPHAA